MTEGASRVSDQYTPRERLAALVARCELDPDGFGEQVRQDPTAALRSARFSEEEANGLLGAGRSVDPGTRALLGGCFDTTCYVSLCPASCFVSVPEIVGVCRGGGTPSPEPTPGPVGAPGPVAPPTQTPPTQTPPTQTPPTQTPPTQGGPGW